MVEQTNEQWYEIVEKVRASGELQQYILDSVRFIMEDMGLEVDEERSSRLLEEALNGSPLQFDLD